MLLAEALAERAQAQERLNNLHERLLTVVRVQEGDTPEEDPQELLRELDGVAGRIDELVQAINATNIATAFDEKRNLMEALALRDGLLRKRRIYHDLARGRARARIVIPATRLSLSPPSRWRICASVSTIYLSSTASWIPAFSS